jgi:hypothetical protein
MLDEQSLAAFVRKTLDGPMLRPRGQQFAAFAQSAAPWIANRVPKVRSALEKRERQVLTDYLLGSNFFQLSDPGRELVVYYGPPVACANPFARLA